MYDSPFIQKRTRKTQHLTFLRAAIFTHALLEYESVNLPRVTHVCMHIPRGKFKRFIVLKNRDNRNRVRALVLLSHLRRKKHPDGSIGHPVRSERTGSPGVETTEILPKSTRAP